MKYLKDLVNTNQKKDWNIEKIKSMTFDKFKTMILGWSDGEKPTIFKPSEKEIKDKWTELTGLKPYVESEKIKKNE